MAFGIRYSPGRSFLSVDYAESTRQNCHLRQRCHGRQVSLHVYCTFFLCVLFLSTASLAQERRTFVVPFHTVNGLISLDAAVNGEKAVLLMDTGARATLLSNLSAPTLQLSKPTYTGQSTRADLRLGSHTIASTFVVVNLEQAKKQVGGSFDGILGQDILREFQAVRIDYKHSVVEFEK